MKEEQAKKMEEKGGQGWGEDKGGERELWEKMIKKNEMLINEEMIINKEKEIIME